MSNTIIVPHHMHGIIPCMFDYWADPVVHLLLLKSSMPRYILIQISNEIKLNESTSILRPDCILLSERVWSHPCTRVWRRESSSLGPRFDSFGIQRIGN